MLSLLFMQRLICVCHQELNIARNLSRNQETHRARRGGPVPRPAALLSRENSGGIFGPLGICSHDCGLIFCLLDVWEPRNEGFFLFKRGFRNERKHKDDVCFSLRPLTLYFWYIFMEICNPHWWRHYARASPWIGSKADRWNPQQG